MNFLNLVLITVIITATTNAGELASSYACPTWYHRNALGQCECSSRITDLVQCEKTDRVKVSSISCMTYDNSSLVTSVGDCPFNRREKLDDIYRELPRDQK